MTVEIQLSRGRQKINPNQEDWELMKRFAHIFHYAVNENTFSGACEQAFDSALVACKQKKWAILSTEQVQDDLARLAVYFRGPLINYAISQNESWITEMIEQRIDIHSLDFQGNTALHTAAREGTAHLIPLLSTHIDIHKENHQKQTPLEIAIQFGKDQVVLELIKKGVNIQRSIFIGENHSISLTGLGFAVMRGEVQCMEKLITAGKCSLHDHHGGIGNILHLAIHFHQFNVLAYLLKEHQDKVSSLMDQKNQKGLTPLILAVSSGEQEPIQLLQKAGASIECEDLQKRRPIHYAALGFHYDTIQLLAALGCRIDPVDEKHQRPIDLIEKDAGRDAESCKTLLKSLKANKALRNLFPSSQFQSPKNLVFRGGGPKGIAFLGALNCLHEKGHLTSVKRVAGTSAGAITASLIATGYPMDQLQELLIKTDLMTFLDHPFSLNKLIKDFKKDNSSVFQVINTLQMVIHTASNIYNNPLSFIANQLKKLYQCTGICEGETFRLWIEEKIKHATGIQYLTFGELSELVKQESKYKHLHVYGTRVGSDPQIVSISSQDPNCRNMIISDAIRISMSIPGVFKPHVMHILQKNGNQRHRIAHPDFGSFLDGGMLYNFPIETFDQKQYLTQEDLGSEGKCPKYNKETIGFSLFSSLTPQKVPSHVENIGDLLKGITQVYLGAEEAIRSLNSYNQSRVIEIDVKDVGTLSFNMSDQKKKQLVASGKDALEAFINKQITPSIPAPIEDKSKVSHLEEKKQQTESRKTELIKKRESHPDDYPFYLDHLLEKGYIHLYDHLLAMRDLSTRNEREEKIKTLPFSEISHIILETQQAVIDKVTSMIPFDTENVLFLLGPTKAGKSTTLCFLRGDEMVLDNNGTYSSKSAQDSLIGNQRGKSCTFFPNIEKLDNVALVDFPGFSDTNGSLIALGMECGLKRLVEKYQSKILVLEAITNNEEGYAAAAQLGVQLKRLLGNTENCILGITKYSKDLNFIKIQSIEADQRKKLSKPTEQEKKLIRQIKTWSEELNESDEEIGDEEKEVLKEKIRKAETKLKLEREKNQPLKSLPEIEDKKEQRQELENKEKELLDQIGLSRYIPLFDLEISQRRDDCLETLSSLKKESHGPTQQTLDEKHERLLKDRFTENLKPIIEKQEFNIEIDEDFEKNVFDTSLIKVLLSSSHPEIVEFFHLPEIDPKLANEFSRDIVEGCIKKLVDNVIKNIDVILIKKVLEAFGEKASPVKKEALQKKQENVQKYIFGLKGKKAEEQTDQEWEKLRQEKQTHLETVEQGIEDQFKLSIPWKIAYTIPLGIPLWMYNSKKQVEKNRVITETIDGFFDIYCQSLDAVYSALVKLKTVENVIRKQEEINQAVKTFTPSLESFESLDKSLEAKVQKVRGIYGSTDWEHRVNILKNGLEQVDKDMVPLLYLGCDPSFEVIKIKGDIMNSRRLLRTTGIVEEDVLFFEKPESGLTVVLKKYKDQEEKLDLCSEAFRNAHQEFFKAGNRIEAINMQTKVSVCGLEKPVSHPVRDTVNKMTKSLKIEINTPLSQTFLSAAIRSKARLDANCFLEEGLIEKPIDLIQFKFGKAKWEKYFGDIGVEPPFPSNIEEILNSPCIFWPDKKVRDTHLLVLVPEKVNGKAFHLDSLSELVKNPKSGHKTEYDYYSDDVKKELGTQSIGSHWVLMTRDVIPESRNKTYENQKALVQKHAQKSKIPYELPKALEAATAILMHHVETGERLYPDVWTRCQEKVNNNQWPAAIGGFSSGGLSVVLLLERRLRRSCGVSEVVGF